MNERPAAAMRRCVPDDGLEDHDEKY